MRLLITGAAGMLGLDVQAAASAAGHEVLGLTRGDLDIADGRAVAAAIEAAAPDALINCAAYTDVDGAQADPAGAHLVNGTGAGHVAGAAAAAGAWTVHISSDYVFDGRKRGPYVESDSTGPLSAYGASKLAGERAVAEAAPGAATIVRTSWLFGAGGACFPRTILRLAGERDRLTVVDDQVGCPTFTGHLADALVRLADARVPGVVHVAAAGECSWFSFAREIVSLAGASAEVAPCTTAEFPRPAPRPANSVLRTEREGDGVPLLPEWRDGLRAYLAETLAAAR